MDERPKARVREGYDRMAAAYLAARPVAGADVALLADLCRALPPGAPVLDAGCGAGVPVTRDLAGAGFRLTALDFSPVQLELARSLGVGSALVQADLAALPFRDGSFAAVVSYYAIIHVPRREHPAVFGEVHRVLGASGLALLCLGAGDLPEDDDPESWLGVPMYWSHFDADTNLGLLGAARFGIEWSRQVLDPMAHGAHLFVLARRS